MVGVSLHKIIQPMSYELSSCGEAKQKSLKHPSPTFQSRQRITNNFTSQDSPKTCHHEKAKMQVWLTTWFTSPVRALHKPAGCRKVTADWPLRAQLSGSLDFSCCAGSAIIAMKSILITPQVNDTQPAIWQM